MALLEEFQGGVGGERDHTTWIERRRIVGGLISE
jgi:hypothetical protein